MEDMKLIGMDGVKALLLDIVRNQEAYRRGKASIPNMIIMMNPRNGQTYTTEDVYKRQVLFETNANYQYFR